jgi:4-amino-4-deoxy-L-arabinose transferase-like glycosyltransferase
MLTFALVRMVHALTLRLANRDAAILAVLLMGTLPMFGIYATSGHFEILNLVMLTLVALLGYHYLRTPSERMLLPLLLALFLLTQVRYESAIYLVTFGLLIIRGWQLAGRIILPWQAFLVPLLYVLPLLHYRLITSGSTRAFQEGPGGREATFSLQYIQENLTSAGRFLFAIGKQQPNSYLLTVCGIAAVVCLCIYALRKPKSFGGARPGPTVLFHLLIGIGMLCGLLAVFNFGLFDNYITNRLSLPLHLLWIIAIPCMLSWMPRVYPLAVLMVAIASAAGVLMVMDEAQGINTGMRFVAVMAVVIVWLMVLWRRPSAPLRQFIVATLLVIAAISLPTSHSALYSQRYDSNRQVMADIHFVEQRSKEQRLLWISNPPPYAGLVNRVSTVPWHMLLPNKEHLMDRLDRHEFDAAYFSALMVRQPDGQYVPHERAPDLSHFETEIVDRVRVAPGRRMDYHRIIGIAKDEE